MIRSKAIKKIKLNGGLENTVSTVEIRDDRSLVIEFYDFSPEAENLLGNDVAYTLTIDVTTKIRVLARLMEENGLIPNFLEDDDLLLQLLEERFKDYFGVQEWLQTNGIAYRKEFDPWA
ncbi:MAG: hypothetical protein AB1489_20005 [Acidobacteriota bacterium]